MFVGQIIMPQAKFFWNLNQTKEWTYRLKLFIYLSKKKLKTKEDHAYMVKLYFDKVFCCRIRDSEFNSQLYKKSIGILTW